MLDYILNDLTFSAVLVNVLSVMLGILFGILPGLTATMGVALLIPLTFGMPADIAFSALLGMYLGAIYAGSITAILISTPGTPAAAAALLEGPALTRQGQSGKALSMTTVASFIGGIFSCVVLIIVAPQLASVALSFGPPEYFAIAIFGLGVVATLSSGALVKGLIATSLGVLLATVGMDPVTGAIRATFGFPELLSGISLTSALVGLFAISQVMIKLDKKITGKPASLEAAAKEDFRNRLSLKDIFSNSLNFLRSSAIGTIVGVIPATGSGTASYIAYNEAKRFAKDKERFGTGHLPGLAATESANNAVTGGALVPLLTLGIPGDVVTAVLLGGLLLQGLTPGPLLFTTNPEIINSIYVLLILSNIFMLVLGLLFARVFSKIIKIPEYYLIPLIVVLCFLGAYGVNNSHFDIYIMLFFGFVGYLMEKFSFPLAPLLLGFILSPLIEENFRTSLILSQDSLWIFVERPICLVFIAITAVVMLTVVYKELRSFAKTAL